MYESLSSQTIKLPMTFPMITDILGPVTAILSVLGTILFFFVCLFHVFHWSNTSKLSYSGY